MSLNFLVTCLLPQSPNHRLKKAHSLTITATRGTAKTLDRLRCCQVSCLSYCILTKSNTVIWTNRGKLTSPLCVCVNFFLSWGIKTCSHKNNKRFIWGFRLVFAVEVRFRVMLRSRCLQEIYVSQYDVLTSIAYQLSDFLCVCVCFLLQLCCFFILLPLQKSLHCPLKSKCHHIQATVSKKHASVVDKSKKKIFFMTFFCLTSLLFSLFIIIIWNLHTVIEFCVDQ